MSAQCLVNDIKCEGEVKKVALVESPDRYAFDLCDHHLKELGEAVREIK